MRITELSKSLKSAFDLRGGSTLPVGDWQGRRANAEKMFGSVADGMKVPDTIATTNITVTGRHGQRIPARVYRKKGSLSRALVVFVHGGGMIMGSIDASNATVARYVELTGIPALSVGYRLAPEHTYPAQRDDVAEAIAWAYSHAGELNLDRNRIGILGHSSGGAIAAGVVLRLRDMGEHPVACQLLVYPMLDDRTDKAGPIAARFLTWSVADNITSWNCLLKGKAGTPDISPYAAPARAKDLKRLPPTYIEVGTLDLFREEDEQYAKALADAGVSVEFHLRRGAPHGFEASMEDLADKAFEQRGAFLLKHLGEPEASD